MLGRQITACALYCVAVSDVSRRPKCTLGLNCFGLVVMSDIAARAEGNDVETSSLSLRLSCPVSAFLYLPSVSAVVRRSVSATRSIDVT